MWRGEWQLRISKIQTADKVDEERKVERRGERRGGEGRYKPLHGKEGI